MRPHKSHLRPAAALAAAMVLLVATAGGAAARSALITIDIDFDTNTETFTSDSALLCPSGDAYTDFHRGVGARDAWPAFTFHLNKLLVCDDGSGSFVIRVDAAANNMLGRGTTGGWSVVPGSGAGDYVGLKGGGSIVGLPGDGAPIDLTDHYYGSLRN